MSSFLVRQMEMGEEEHSAFLATEIKKNGGLHPPGGYRLVKGEHRFIVDHSDTDDRHATHLGAATWLTVIPST